MRVCGWTSKRVWSLTWVVYPELRWLNHRPQQSEWGPDAWHVRPPSESYLSLGLYVLRAWPPWPSSWSYLSWGGWGPDAWPRRPRGQRAQGAPPTRSATQHCSLGSTRKYEGCVDNVHAISTCAYFFARLFKKVNKVPRYIVTPKLTCLIIGCSSGISGRSTMHFIKFFSFDLK